MWRSSRRLPFFSAARLPPVDGCATGLGMPRLTRPPIACGSALRRPRTLHPADQPGQYPRLNVHPVHSASRQRALSTRATSGRPREGADAAASGGAALSGPPLGRRSERAAPMRGAVKRTDVVPVLVLRLPRAGDPQGGYRGE